MPLSRGILFSQTKEARLSLPLLLTAQLGEGDKAILYPLSGPKIPPEFPSLRQAQESRFIRLREIHINEDAPQISLDPKNKGKRRDWLPLLAKEVLGASHGMSHDPARLVRI